jgi:hypothetical protein
MPDSGPGEGHIDHQQAEEGGTAARREQCLLLLFNLGNLKKSMKEITEEKKTVTSSSNVCSWERGREESRSPKHHQHTSGLFLNKYSKDDISVYSLLLLFLSCIEGYACRLC